MINKENIFRRDVDILRGLAVILVVLYHLDIKFFQSGFIGVDIFFVLSGYLIGSIYARHQNSLDFYEKRFRRILPAMLATLIVFLVASPFLFLPFEVRKVTDSIVGSLLFVPNLVFWRDNDYFSNLSFSPLLHYWSLGVELQYYVIFPLLFFMGKKFKAFFPVLAIISLGFCIFLTDLSSKSAFFFLPTRLWEFFLGYFAYQIRDVSFISKFKRTKASSYFSILILLLLIIITTLPIPSDKFPGVYAIAPVVMCFIYIAVGIESERFLNFSLVKVIRWFAKVSFSIYLIHYPVIFIFKYSPFSETNELTMIESIVAVIITLILAIVSYRYIESPMRDKSIVPLKKFFIILIAAYSFIIMLLFIFSSNGYFKDLYGEQKAAIFYAMDDRGAWRCSKWQKLKELKSDSCYLLHAHNAEKKVYLVGDSHIDVLKDVFTDSAIDKKISVRLNKTRCLLGREQCSYEKIVSEVNSYEITDIVMHGYDSSKFHYHDIEKLVLWVAQNNVRLHIIGPVPTYNRSVPSALFQETLTSNRIIQRISLNEFESRLPEKYVTFKSRFNGYKNVYFYRPEDFLCAPECRLLSPKGVFYFDSNHLTLKGANELVPMILDIYSK
ncbi:MAG TPA: hypothetical protein DIW64_11230 [Cellvibrio sp.]|nr:hypothetical protein [Cellvibrio sp.]